jgi:hypothetical protein
MGFNSAFKVLTTILSPAGQFSSMDNPHTVPFHSRPAAAIICFLVHGSKIVNFHNAVTGDI